VTRARVALTHSPGRLEELQSLLAARGFEVLRRPLVEVVPRSDPRTRAAAQTLLELPWMLLTSRSTVEALIGMGVGFGGPRLGAIGPATAAALLDAGAGLSLTAAPHNGEGLARTFLAHPDARGPVGLPRGNLAQGTLERTLGEAGMAVMPVVVYDTVAREWTAEQVDAVVLTSPSAVAALPEDVGRLGRIVTLGSTTSRAARDRGWRCEEASAPTPEAAVEAVERVLI
jgi:uroporphyrinogen-III synthase